MDSWRPPISLIGPETYSPNGCGVVLCHGVFDVLHLGHIRHLEEAKKQGDSLIVSVTSDRYAAKAPGRPVNTAEARAAMLSSLSIVDAVIINDAPTALPIIESLKPAVYCKGREYANGKDQIGSERAAVESYGGRVHFTDGPTMSSSALINRTSDPILSAYLARARSLGFAEKIPELIAQVSDMHVLFIGETIIDEYVYVSALSKPSKEFILAGHRQSAEVFEGGVKAAANHLRSFVKSVDVISHRKVKKTRFVEKDFGRKLFEVYDGDLTPVLGVDERTVIEQIAEKAPLSDLVVITDFGHGMMTDAVRRAVFDHAPFVAVNAQSNAGNQGFNSIAKYMRANYVCVDAPEARLALGERHMDTVETAKRLKFMGTDKLIVTDGNRGCVTIQGERVPAVSAKPLDTMGAGDAFLSVTAPLAKLTDDMELVGFVGNLAGAIKVQYIGHRSSVDKATVLRYAGTLLK